MVTPDALALAALQGESLQLRSLVQDFVRDHARFIEFGTNIRRDLFRVSPREFGPMHARAIVMDRVVAVVHHEPIENLADEIA